MRWILIILLLAGLALGSTAQAQETPPSGFPTADPVTPTAAGTEVTPTITPTTLPTVAVTSTGIVFTASAEVIFPVGVRFTTIVLREPEEISSVRLTVTPQTSSGFSTELDLTESVVTTTPNPELAYFWAFDPATPPALFEEITFEFIVTSIYDESDSAQGVFQFTDSRLLWDRRTVQDRRFDLAIPRGEDVNRLGGALDVVYERLSENTGAQPQLSLLLYDRRIDPFGCEEREDGFVATGPFSGTEVTCPDPQLASRIFAAGGYEVVQTNAFGFVQAEADLTQWLVNRFYADQWPESSDVMPDWFRSGLARLYQRTPDSSLQGALIDAAQAGRLFSLRDLAEAPRRTDPTWDAQSFGMVLYIADQIGLEALFELARPAGDTPFAQRYQQAVGQPISTLIPAMRDWLFSERASGAYRFSIYQAATPVPEPTLTFTPFPPTRTPRPAPSPTLTPTITLTSTPRPTATPTATVTPRPPGSLYTPTPVPTVVNQPLIETGSRTSILAVLLIIVAVLIIVYARVGRR